jgi:hypothetical protein
MNRHVAVAVIAMFGCHKRAGSDYFGTQVVPPGVLAKIRPGMTVDELEQLVPKLVDDDGHGLLLEQPASNIKLYAVALDGAVVDTYVDYAGSDGLDVLTAAWGPPDAEHDRDEHDELAWRNATTGWRARLFCGHGTKDTPLPPFCTITFHPHKPLEAMFGRSIAPVGEMAAAKPDMSLDALRAATHLPFNTPDAHLNRNLDYDGASELAALVDGKLVELSYRLPKLARPMIDKAWGSGSTGSDGETVWFDAQSGWFARQRAPYGNDDTFSLAFAGYMPFDKLVDVLDSMTTATSYDDAHKAHPELPWTDEKDGQHVLAMPYTEQADPATALLGHTLVGIYGHARPAFALNLDAKKADAIVASLTKRWGQPKTTIDNPKDPELAATTYRWAGHASLLRSGDGRELGLTVGGGM